MNFSYYIARRYLFSKKSRNVINIISGISMFVVAGVTCAMIIVLSALNGIEDLVRKLFDNFETEISIQAARGKTFESNDSLKNYLDSSEDILIWSEVIEEDVWVRNQVRDVNTVCTIKGVDKNYIAMTRMDSMMYLGDFVLEDEDYYYAVLGLGVYSELQVYLRNDEITSLFVNAPIRGKKLSKNRENAFKSLPVVVSGAYTVNAELDVKYIFTSIDFCRELFDYENEISAIEVILKDGASESEVKERLQAYLGDQFKVETRAERNALVYQTNESEKWAVMVILLFILIIAAFNIVASLSMLIIEKKKDIFILRGMGAREETIKKIFVTEGILIYFVGAIAGLLVGLLVCIAQQKFGLLRIEGATVEFYPIKVILSDLLIIMISVMAVGLLFSKILVSRLLRKFV